MFLLLWGLVCSVGCLIPLAITYIAISFRTDNVFADPYFQKCVFIAGAFFLFTIIVGIIVDCVKEYKERWRR